jgi:CRISPR-associated exonuclease Cas4
VTPEPVSAQEHHLYCPRQCALINVDSIWGGNAHTIIGQRVIVVWTAGRADMSVIATFLVASLDINCTNLP